MGDQKPVEQTKSATFFVKGEKIVLKRDATWVADGIEISHEPTRELFYRSIHWDADARSYCLKVGYETIHIEVEDAPFFVTALESPRSAHPMAKPADGRSIAIAPTDLKYESGSLYLSLGDGQRAKFLSAPYYDILRGLEEDGAHYYLTIDGMRAELAKKG